MSNRVARPLILFAAFAGSLVVGLTVVLWLLGGLADTRTAATIGGGPFKLTDQTGQTVTEKNMVGRPTIIFFGYTHCPDVCPTTMAEMAGWFEALGEDAKDLKAYFVTVDPERDTPEQLDSYVSWINGRVTGVTGSPEEIARIVKAWGVVAEKVPGSAPDEYTMNHTASVFLVNARGEFEGTIAYQESQDTAVAKIRRLVSES
jgi:protein SCO1/2